MRVGKAAFLVRASGDVHECLRSAAGLGVENMEVGVFLLNAAVPAGRIEDDAAELMEMIDDLEGRSFTTVAADAERFEFLEHRTVDDFAGMIRDYDLIRIDRL